MRLVIATKVRMHRWIRLNIYSLLIAAGGLVLLATALSIMFSRISWLWTVPFVCGAVAMFRMAQNVFAKYEDKCKVMERLKGKLAKGYDQRYFLPYMGTACYRHVVYFALADCGLEDRYAEIRSHYRKWGFQRDKPKTTKFRIVRGRIVFDGEVLSEIETDNADDRPSSKQSKEEKHEKQKIG